MTTIPPSHTLYVKDLNDKVKKEELRRSLYNLFSAHGRVLDVVALKTHKMRGQAFVVFREIASATAAMRNLQGFPFYDKPITITYAKSKSNAIKMREGSYSLTGRPAAGPISGAQKRIRDDDSDSDDDAGPPRKRNEGEGDEEMEDAEAPSDANANPPNRILFVRNFPADAEAALGPLFQQYPGFQEVRTVPGKPGMAFVEYETDGLAERAKTGLDGFKLSDTSPLIVEFAKK